MRKDKTAGALGTSNTKLKKRRIKGKRIMKIKQLSFILLFMTLTIPCHLEEKNMTYMVRLFWENIFLKGPLINGYSISDTIYFYPDTMYILKKDNKEKIVLAESGKGSNITGLLYLLKRENSWHIIKGVFDSLSIFDINIIFSDLDEKPPKEIISTWIHEGDIFFIRIDRIEGDKILNIFVSKDLGIPWICKNQPVTIRNDTLVVSYVLDDNSACETAIIKINNKGQPMFKVVKHTSIKKLE
jgi:hypothetical protein